MARLGAEVFDRQVRPALRPEDDGKFVAVDIGTGDYELDDDDDSAVTRLRTRRPSAEVWLGRVGQPGRTGSGGADESRSRLMRGEIQMEELEEYLQRMHEEVPTWLGEFNAEDQFNRDDFFTSRVVYYPGAGTDGQPVKLFGSTHAAHCFVYVDYGITQAQMEEQLADPRHGFLGYHPMRRIQLAERDLTPQGWDQHAHDVGPNNDDFVRICPFGFLEVLERDQDQDDRHGAPRLAILFLGADGIAAYDALFCQGGQNPPFAVVVQDHGFGGNWDRFGRGGLLERIAGQCAALPEWLLVGDNGDNNEAWEGYERVPDVVGNPGGMHRENRFLYRKIDPAKLRVAEAAAALVEDGMVVGLGSGTTAALVVRRLSARMVTEGLRCVGVPTSVATAELADELGVPLRDIDAVTWLDLSLDGADEIDPQFRMIKGRGGALLREKIVATTSRRRVTVITSEKQVERLGLKAPIPIEVSAVGVTHTERRLRDLGAETALRLEPDGSPFVTDGGNRIIDCRFPTIDDPTRLDCLLQNEVGVFETGLFIGLCDAVLIGHPDRVELVEARSQGRPVT